MERKNECRVGVTGHRILTDLDRLREGIDEALRKIEKAFPAEGLTLYSSLAEGADQLVAQAVLGRPGGHLMAVLPLPADEYAQDFLTEAGFVEFERLLRHADKILIQSPTSEHNQAYEDAGLLILEECDVMLAVWDGQAAQATGGTGGIVTACRAQRKPLIIVRAGNRKPGTFEPTTLGDAQGQIMTENFPAMSAQVAASSQAQEDQAGTKERIDNDEMKANPQSLKERYGEVVSLALGKEKLKKRFWQFEQTANIKKKLHNSLGLLALVLLIGFLVFSVFRLVASVLPLNLTLPDKYLTWVLPVGMMPVIIALGLNWGEVRKKWVLARYKAERIRHWEFHQLLNGPYIEGLETNPVGFDTAWREFMYDLDGGHAGLENFIEHSLFRPTFSQAQYQNGDTFKNVWKAYYHERLELQIKWFTQEKNRYEDADTRSEAAARALLFSGAVLSFLEFGFHILSKGAIHHEAGIWLPGLAIMFLLLSAGVRVYRSASGISENAERYRTVQARLHHYQQRMELDADLPQAKVLETMFEVERVCHAELVEFLRVAQKSDYLL